MNKGSVLGLAVLLLALVAGCDRPEPVASTPRGPTVAADIDRAVAIAVLAVKQKGQPVEEYTLTSAERIIHHGKYIWRITFKSNKLLPGDPSMEAMGLGGEIFVNVDLRTQKAEVLYGE